jgi:hypothetical protein
LTTTTIYGKIGKGKAFHTETSEGKAPPQSGFLGIKKNLIQNPLFLMTDRNLGLILSINNANTMDLDTILGQFSFDAVGDAVYDPQILIVKDGEFAVFE